MKKHTYLDNASSSFPKPRQVAKAVADAIGKVGANPGRGGHILGAKADRIVFDAREALARLLNLPDSGRLIFTKNATEGINLALKGLLKPGDRAAVSRLEHNAVMRPLSTLAKRGVAFEYAPADENGLPDPANVPDVKALVTVAGSNVTGAMADLPALARECRRKGTLLIVDAAQTAGAVPLDGSEIDVLVCAGHKGLLGPQGTGLAWFAPGVEPEPLLEGGTGSGSESVDMPAFWPDRQEAGTLNTPGIAGLGAAAGYLLDKGVEAVREKETGLCRMLIEGLGNEAKVETYPPFDHEKRCSLVCFNVAGMDPAQVGDGLASGGVAVRVGLHCSPEAHKFMGTFPGGAVRVSPGPFTAKKDVKRFFEVLGKVMRGK